MRHLDEIGVPYRVIVEEQEFDRYAEHIDRTKLLVLDPEYQRSYDAFMPLEPGQSRGSGPARNFAWDTAAAEGAPWHWTMDDNIQRFYRLNRNSKIPVADGTCFRVMQDFVERFVNVGMAGPAYEMFAPRRNIMPPFTLNTRIFSCNLIRTDAPFRWRGRYNEDADLSFRMLKAGWSTVQFNAFLQNKIGTMKVKGGNTDSIYVGGTLPKSQMLADMHPDIVRVVWRYGRAHHHADMTGFKGLALVPREGVRFQDGVNEYGMKLEDGPGGRTVSRVL